MFPSDASFFHLDVLEARLATKFGHFEDEAAGIIQEVATILRNLWFAKDEITFVVAGAGWRLPLGHVPAAFPTVNCTEKRRKVGGNICC